MEKALSSENSVNSSTSTSNGFARPAVQWINSYEDGLALAKEENFPMMIEFYIKYYPVSESFEKKIFSNSEAADLSTNFILVKLEFEKNQDIAIKYGVSDLPALVFTGPDGKNGLSIVGDRNIEDILSTMRKVVKAFGGKGA